MELHGLVSVHTSPRAWDLRCEVREKMIAWLQETHLEALPRLRAEVGGDSEPERREAAGARRLEPGESALAASAPDRLRQPRDIHE
jgi:hypothetical protein